MLAARYGQRGQSAELQRQALTALRRFGAWLVRTRRRSWNPGDSLTMPRRPLRLPRTVLSAVETERVLAMPDVARPWGLRDRAILEVLYSTGIRRRELVMLRPEDLNGGAGELRIRHGKGGRERLTPIGNRAVLWVERYLDEVRPRLARRQGRTELFLTLRGGRLRENRLSDRVRGYLIAAGLGKSGSCHVFRHTMATLMLEGGADLRAVQEMLGHAHLSTTALYTHLSIQRLKRVHAQAHPAG